jgi:uncharacterized OB-fold protein
MDRTAVVYTETIVHLAPPAFASEAPYQVAIVEFDDGQRLTARIIGDRVSIGDKVIETNPLHDAPAFQKA